MGEVENSAKGSSGKGNRYIGNEEMGAIDDRGNSAINGAT